MNFGPQTPKNVTIIFTHPCKCCVLLRCQCLEMEVAEQNSTKLCDMLGSRPDLQTHVKNWRSFSLKIGEQKLLILWPFQLDKTMPDAEKLDRIFYSPPVNACHDNGASGIGRLCIANVNDAIETKSLVSRGPKHFRLPMTCVGWS